MSHDDDRIERMEEALARIAERRAAGDAVSVEAIVAENPDLAEPLRSRLRLVGILDGLRDPQSVAALPSVLDSLSSEGLAVRPVSLPELPDDDAPSVVLPKWPSGRWGRYAVHGQIARGGVGVVLRARDPDLGRDVALKVLREEHAKSPDVLQRFVEEAQVGGQLQHPGIVTVHELGMSSDGQPFFAMRLVRGRTLASLLAARESPATDRPRFVSVFESVCQTVAYAHERRIVHRDLKPSNVMVGTFGEVQVLDWGMAKILASGGAADDARTSRGDSQTVVQTVRSNSGSAPSLEGSVLGTPQYMAPEQARGQTADLDERADVFSLGAILCEILTGKPPYLVKEDEVLAAAAAGNVGPAHERLRGCGADPQLVSLAIRCLAATRADRPRNASVVARKVTAHLASLEERARKAEVVAAEARVEAVGERKARRLTLSLSAAVVAFLLAGGGFWLWLDAQRRAHTEAAGREVADALDETTRLRAKAEAAEGDAALPIWREAAASARRAQAVAKAGEADEATRARAESVATAIGEASVSADGAAERRRRDAALAERFDRIYALGVETWDWKAASASFAAAFEEALGADVTTTGVAEAARRIDASPSRERLRRALLKWLAARMTAREDPTLLRELVARADTDPWRASVRAAAGDLAKLRDIASNARLDALDAQDVVYLADSIGLAGDAERAASLASEAWRRHPGDYDACAPAMGWLARCTPPRYAEMLRFATAAVAIQPRSAMAHRNLGVAHSKNLDAVSAIAEFHEAIRLDPNLASAHSSLGIALRSRTVGDRDAKIAEHREAIRLEPNEATFHSQMGLALTRPGESDEALRETREAVRLDPKLAFARVCLGCVLQRQGQLSDAILECREAIRLDPKSALARGSLGDALADQGDLDGAIAESQEAIRLDPTCAMGHAALGKTLLATHDAAGATREYREVIRLGFPSVTDHFSLGKALCATRDFDGAIAAYREAIRLDPGCAAAHLSLGNSLAESRDFDGAITAIREAIRLDPKSGAAYSDLGRALWQKGDLDGAMSALREAVQLDPTSARSRSRMGLVLQDLGDLDGSIAAQHEAIRLDAKLLDGHVNLGAALRMKGDLDGSIAASREAIRLDANCRTAHHNLGIALGEKGDVDGAIAAYREELRIDPARAEAHRSLGDTLKDKGALDDAIREFREAVRLAPRSARMLGALGSALAKSGDMDGGMAALREAIQVDALDAWAHSCLSACHRERGEKADATAEAREAARLAPQDAGIRRCLGRALSDEDEVEGALAEWREAVRLEPNRAEFRGSLGACLHRAGDLDGAIAAYREALRLDPRNAYAQVNVARALASSGRVGEAVAAYREAVALDSKYACAHLGLSVVLDRSGDRNGATAEAREAARLDPAFGAAERLSAFARGQTTPSTSQEALDLRRVAMEGALYVASSRAFARALALDPACVGDVRSDHRYDAACAAALAAAGRGLDASGLSDAERSRLRRKAIDWLRADLDAWKKSGDAKGIPQEFKHWKVDSDLVGLRSGPQFEKLPATDREACRLLWAEVDALLSAATPPR